MTLAQLPTVLYSTYWLYLHTLYAYRVVLTKQRWSKTILTYSTLHLKLPSEMDQILHTFCLLLAQLIPSTFDFKKVHRTPCSAWCLTKLLVINDSFLKQLLIFFVTFDYGMYVIACPLNSTLPFSDTEWDMTYCTVQYAGIYHGSPTPQHIFHHNYQPSKLHLGSCFSWAYVFGGSRTTVWGPLGAF